MMNGDEDWKGQYMEVYDNASIKWDCQEMYSHF